MLIFIENLPGDATLVDLEKILKSEISRMKCSFHRGERKDKSEYHCLLVNTQTDDVGHQLIARINGRKLGDHKLAARQYIDRENPTQWQGENRRIKQLALDFRDNLADINSWKRSAS